MTRRTLLLNLGLSMAGGVHSAPGGETRSEKLVSLGETRVRVVVAEVSSRGKHSYIYFHPHENEHGSAVITRHVIEQMGGRLVEIRSQGDRLITFKLKGKTYSFDPNRMFTDIGLAHSLTHYGPSVQAAVEAARNLRNASLSLLGNGKTPIIAVHNNAESGMSVLSFKGSGGMSAQASKVAVNPKENPHDFFLVLEERLFQKLHDAGFNVVLQSPECPDDGSLSVFCQQHGWRYVNVEAAESDMAEQQRMLMALLTFL